MTARPPSPLRLRPYRVLFFSSLTSTLGDWLDFVAVAVLVVAVWQQGPSGLAAVAVAVALPHVAAPFIGVLVDRWPVRPVLVGADLGRAALTLAMVFAPGPLPLAALLALRSVGAVAFAPTAQRALQRCVPTAGLIPANALLQTMTQALKVAGPAIGGGLLAVASPPTLIAANAVSFLASAAILAGLRLPPRTAPPPTGGYLAQLREGLSFVVRDAALRLTVVALGATVFLAVLFDSMLPLALPALGLAPAYFGYVVATVGLGGVAGAAVLARWGAAVRPFTVIAAGQLVTGATVALAGSAALAGRSVPGAALLAAGLVIGAAGAGVLVGFPTVVQRSTPERLLGRVWTAIAFVPAVLQIAAPAAGAAVLAHTRVGWLFAVAGAGLAGLGLVTLAGQRRLSPDPATPDLTEPATPDRATASSDTIGRR
ncbi:MFS transporter [Phytohabitans rumicis]|uniref:Putative MFS-type transporter YfiS n=1 Tax=Phytohabitans rumicis TaxID=1076125 RepID=A0A6V8KPS0_9ACTN|nr:MFS transporter [Phytohabitans rumicis]GFJ87162.1 putative MFS-type transporter YfiS [Phytohabitans rumicis]